MEIRRLVWRTEVQDHQLEVLRSWRPTWEPLTGQPVEDLTEMEVQSEQSPGGLEEAE